MKLGQNFFRKDQSIWGKPIIAYDQTKINELFSEIEVTENHREEILTPAIVAPGISLETELYLILNS